MSKNVIKVYRFLLVFPKYYNGFRKERIFCVVSHAFCISGVSFVNEPGNPFVSQSVVVAVLTNR